MPQPKTYMFFSCLSSFDLKTCFKLKRKRKRKRKEFIATFWFKKKCLYKREFSSLFISKEVGLIFVSFFFVFEMSSFELSF